MKRPIFFDASGRRNRWTMRGFFALTLVVILAVIAFAMTVVEVPIPGPLATVSYTHLTLPTIYSV